MNPACQEQKHKLITALESERNVTTMQSNFRLGLALVSVALISFLIQDRKQSSADEKIVQTLAGHTHPQVKGCDKEVIRAQETRSINIPVTAVACVARILEDDNVGIPHQKFLIELSNGTTVLIAHNTRMAPRVPIKVNDLVTVHGDYVWNKRGGLIHWTHSSNSPRHQGGWIELAGKIYK